MTHSLFQGLFTLLERTGYEADDSEDRRLQKLMGAWVSLIACLVIYFLSSVQFLIGNPIGGAIIFVWATWHAVTLFIAHWWPRTFDPIASFNATLPLLVGALFTLLYGGIIESGGMALVGITTPFVHMIFGRRHRIVITMMAAFVCLMLLLAFYAPSLTPLLTLSRPLLNVMWAISIITCAVFVLTVLLGFMRQRDLYRDRSESLLLNILPREITAILKQEQRTIADYYENASVLFADVVNFTPMSTTMTPVALVDLLNEVFSAFDLLAEKYGVEKIKTIGDCYMVAAGVPRPRPDHAQVLAQMALDIQAYVATHTFQGRKLDFRIGINSGPVVAGVIGRQKFIYDLWGDAVNTASRMESQGKDGTIQITQATHELIKERFVCESRGVVSIKGKGEMAVWAVVSANNQPNG